MASNYPIDIHVKVWETSSLYATSIALNSRKFGRLTEQMTRKSSSGLILKFKLLESYNLII